MSKFTEKLKHFGSELRRRKTDITAVGYLILIFAVVGPASDILTGLDAPAWVLRYAIITLFIAFPLVIVLSWFFDFTFLHGFERTRDLSDQSEVNNSEPKGLETDSTDEDASEILRLKSARLSVPIDLSENRQVAVFTCSITATTGGQDDPELIIGFVESIDNELNEIISLYDGERLASGRNTIAVAFGFPQTHEDETRRAARTALEVLSLIDEKQLADASSGSIVVRGGIHTETIIIEENALDKDAISVLGETISLAEYLNSIAPENTVVVSPQSHNVLKQYFIQEEIQQISHPRIGDSQPVFKLVKALAGQLSNILTRQSVIYGRDTEQQLLLQQWNSVLDGESQFILIKGEPGIGKSSLLVTSIQKLLETEVPFLVTLDCEPYFKPSPLRPVITFLERIIDGDEHIDDSSERLQKLDAFLEGLPIDKATALPLMASLLSIDMGEQDLHRDADTEELGQLDYAKTLRAKTQGFLVEFIHAFSEVQPIVLVVEDLQWADSSTAALIELLIAEAPDHRILGIFTARPEFEAEWVNLDHVMEINLQKLNSHDAAIMIQEQAGEQVIPENVIKQIVSESNGVPLYIEQLTGALLESGVVFQETEVNELEIPTSLKESLAARINNLGSSKPLLQLCAVIGFEFPYRLLLEVCETDDENLLISVLKNIVKSGFLYQKGVFPDAVFRFRHRLVMEAASQSLLRKTRQNLHSVIAQTLESSFPSICENRPTELAVHYSEAGDVEKAIGYWIKAARRSQSKYANDEVILQANHGLQLLDKVTDEEKAKDFEITLQKLCGEASLILKGYASPDMRKAFERVFELSDNMDESEKYIVIVGLWMHHVIRGDYRRALELAQQLVSTAITVGSDPELLQAHYGVGYTLYYMGEIDQAQQSFQKAFAHDRPGVNYTRQSPNADDTRIILYSHFALTYWAQGDSVTARQHAATAVELARSLDQPWGLVRALYFSSILHLVRGETAAAAKDTEEMLSVSQENGFQWFILLGKYLSATSIPDDESRLKTLIGSLDNIVPRGARNGITIYVTIIIRECIKQSQWDSAKKYLELNDKFISETNENVYASEQLRLKALLLSHMNNDDDNSESLKLLQQGIEHGLIINNKPFALRCALSLVEMSGSSDSAISQLKGILESFPAADDTEDFKRATEIIEGR
ncbi:MAG: AAA family ATPase [Gammaproteobacteria bacterium]|nr:AAA family ATPase [Gammaproteobacteria bacterium]